jgi:hypothetical protein
VQSVPSHTLKVDFKKGQVSGLQIGDKIAKVLAYVQMHVQVFGRIELVAPSKSKELDTPLFIVLPESGNLISL